MPPDRYDLEVPQARFLYASDVPATLYLKVPGQVYFYGWKDVDVVLWETVPDVGSVQRVGDVVPQRMHDCGHKLSVVHVLYPDAGLPSQLARAELSRIGKRWRDCIACIGLVVEGGGLRLTAWRGVLTGIVLVSPVRRTVSVVSTIAEIAGWLSEQHAKKTGHLHNPDELLRMLRSVRAATRDPEI